MLVCNIRDLTLFFPVNSTQDRAQLRGRTPSVTCYCHYCSLFLFSKTVIGFINVAYCCCYCMDHTQCSSEAIRIVPSSEAAGVGGVCHKEPMIERKVSCI